MHGNLSEVAKDFVNSPVRAMESLKLKSGLKIYDLKKLDCIGFLLVVFYHTNLGEINYQSFIENSLYRPSEKSYIQNTIEEFVSKNPIFYITENLEPIANSILVFILDGGYLHFGFCEIENKIPYIIHANSAVKKVTREILSDDLKKFLINIIAIK